MHGMRNSANFCVFLTVAMVLTKYNTGPYKSLFGSSPSLVNQGITECVGYSGEELIDVA